MLCMQTRKQQQRLVLNGMEEGRWSFFPNKYQRTKEHLFLYSQKLSGRARTNILTNDKNTYFFL